MTSTQPPTLVRLAVEPESLVIPLELILPLRDVPKNVRQSVKYAQIAASIAEVGIIEPPVVARTPGNRDGFHLLDGHIRVAIVRERGDLNVECLVALDDEAYTYNKRVSRLAAIQEHQMVLNAVSRGVSEERLSRALNVNIASIRAKRNLLSGICPEVAHMLRDRNVPLNVFTELRFLKAVRQIEVAQLMIAANRFSIRYARSLVAATPPEQLSEKTRRRPRPLTQEQISLLQRESVNLDREYRLVERSYGADHLDLVLAIGFVTSLLGSAPVVGYLARHHPEILSQFQRLSDAPEAA
jgi:ParB-like chromosome segregation protein Spo0J